MLRLNHPETFHGAVASGSPLNLDCANYPNSTSQWIQPDWVSTVYEDLSRDVSNVIKQSWPVLHKMMASGNQTAIQDELNLCTAPSNATDLATLESMLTTGLQRASQFNYPLAASTSTNVSFPLQYIISHSENSTSPLAPLKAYTSIGWVSANRTRPECYDWAAGGSAAVGDAGVSQLPFAYITCTYFPLKCGATRPGNILPPSNSAELRREVPLAQCKPYGLTRPLTPSMLNQKYDYSQAGIAKATNIIFTLGQYDPITGYAVKDFRQTGDRSAPRKLYVSDMAHTQDLLVYNPADSQPVLDVRNTTVQYIKA